MEQQKKLEDMGNMDKVITISLDEQNERLLRMIESCSDRSRQELVRVIFRVGLIESVKDLELRVRAYKDLKIGPKRKSWKK